MISADPSDPEAGIDGPARRQQQPVQGQHQDVDGQDHQREAAAREAARGVADAGPSVLFVYTPPDEAAVRRGCCRQRWCPACPLLTRAVRRFRSWAEWLGLCVSGRWVSGVLCPVLLMLQLWALGFCFLGEEVGPGGELFRLATMFISAQVAGWMVLKVADMPALVGMLVVGVAMRSGGYLAPTASSVGIIAILRKIALSLIMIRAGLGLDPGMLRSVSLLVAGLAVVPATVEVAAITVCSYFLLDLPWLWGVLLGLVLAAVAPSVVMPCFMELRAQRLGADRGIDTLVIAAASFDDVIAISIFGVILGLIFTGGAGASIQDLVQPPLGLLFGLLFGAAWGKALQMVPVKGTRHLSMWRFALTLGGALVVAFGAAALGYGEAGPVGCIVSAFIAAVGWRAREAPMAVDDVDRRFAVLWAVFEPIMFSLIGADINTDILDGSLVGLAIACIVISLLFRMLSTWLLLLAAGWPWKERLFVALAWLPKADVQAALGPLALDAARKALPRRQDDEDRATAVLLVAVLAIILTAPAGAAVISALGRRLLTPAPAPAPPLEPSQHRLEGGTVQAD